MTSVVRITLCALPFPSAMTVQQARESAWLVGSDGDLLDDADAAAVAHRGDDEVLHVDGREVERIEDFEPDRLASAH
jgi:hypothetical protein